MKETSQNTILAMFEILNRVYLMCAGSMLHWVYKHLELLFFYI